MIQDKVASQPPAYDLEPESSAAAVVIPPSPPLPSNSNMSDAEWQAKLTKLQRQVRKYNWTKRGDEAAILQSMRDLSASHDDPKVKAYWTQRADAFEKAPDSDKIAILRDIGLALAILVAAPLAAAGLLFTGTGMILKGTGTLLKASGNFVMGGKTRFT